MAKPELLPYSFSYPSSPPMFLPPLLRLSSPCRYSCGTTLSQARGTSILRRQTERVALDAGSTEDRSRSDRRVDRCWTLVLSVMQQQLDDERLSMTTVRAAPCPNRAQRSTQPLPGRLMIWSSMSYAVVVSPWSMSRSVHGVT